MSAFIIHKYFCHYWLITLGFLFFVSNGRALWDPANKGGGEVGSSRGTQLLKSFQLVDVPKVLPHLISPYKGEESSGQVIYQ
jgi:hypothetical protein